MAARSIGTKKLIGLSIGLLLPILSVYLCLSQTHDAILTIWITTLVCYTAYCWVYDIAFASFKWSWFIGKETKGFFGKCLDGLGFTLMFSTITASTIVCFCIFSPWGITKFTLPFPYFGNSMDTFYAVFFGISYLIILPMGEEGFYRVFQGNQWKGEIPTAIISCAYGLMNFVAFCLIFEGWLGRILLTAAAIGTCYIYIGVRDSLDIVYCLMTKIGVNLGMGLWIYWMWMTVERGMPRRQPKYFYVADMDNIWMSVF